MRQRQGGDGIGVRVAQQRRQEHRFTRPIDAALGGREQIERARRRPTVDAAIGQIERRSC